jgi:predicted DNA-binding protein
MHKTTINLPTDLHLRIRNLAERTGRPIGAVITGLLSDALEHTEAGEPLALVASGEADVDDLAIHAEKYLAEGLG